VRLLDRFSPARRPVLSRVLIAQACLARLTLQTFHEDLGKQKLLETFAQIVKEQRVARTFAWDDADEMPALEVALRYWTDRLGWIASGRPWN
jgi:hypothetical protein